MVNLRKLRNRMKEKKDLSLVYALKEYARVNGKGGPIIEDKRCFTFDDIKAAFNAGRESVVENMPKIEWEKCIGGLVNKDQFRDWYIEVDEFAKQKYTLVIPGEIPRCFTTLKEAKQAANEDYKKRIKQSLGL